MRLEKRHLVRSVFPPKARGNPNTITLHRQGKTFCQRDLLNNGGFLQISIITAVFNRVDTIGQAVGSVSNQLYSDVEHVIIDGGSTDGTLDEVERCRAPHMRVISERDSGIYNAINKGIMAAKGDVLGLVHSDDFFADALVLERVAAAFQDSAIDAVYGDLDYVSPRDPARVVRRWRSGKYTNGKLRRGWMPPHPTLFLRRNVFAQYGLYNEDYRISADYEAVLRYFSRGVRPAYIPEVLVKMRVGGESNRSLERILHKSREDYRALRENNVGGIGVLACKNLRKLPQFIYR